MSIFGSNKEKQEPATPAYTPPKPAVSTPTPTTNYTTSNNSSSSNMTNIASGTIIDGQIKVEGDIKVDGIVKGTVTSKGKVQVASTGKVDGDIICQNAEISGHVSGKLKVADILMLKGSAVIDGDINTGKIVIESGVKFNGNCTMGVATQAAAPKVEAPKTTTSSVSSNAQ